MNIGSPTTPTDSSGQSVESSPESTPEMTSRDSDVPNWEKRLSIATSLSTNSNSDSNIDKNSDNYEPMLVEPKEETQQQNSNERQQKDQLLPPSLPPATTSASSPRYASSQRNNNRLTSIARTAARATKEQFWDSNESGIVAAQTAVDRWEDIYGWVRNAVVASNRSVAGVYDASKAGVRGLDRGLLVPVRDYVLLPTFGFAEHVVSETSSFLRSSEAERIRNTATEGSSEFISRVVPFGMGDSVVLPAVRLGADTVKNAWDVARYPVPSQKQVRDTVDFWLNGSKHNLSVCGREIIWYVRRADASIGRTFRRTQWTVLGRGPYETLDDAGRRDVMDHVCERYLSIGSGGQDDGDNHSDSDSDNHIAIPTALMVARYEFMANVRACNPSLHRDLVETGLLKDRGGVLTMDDEWLSTRPRYRNNGTDLFLLNENGNEPATTDKPNTVFALWFRLPFENGQRPKRDIPWITFDQKEGAMLEEKYRSVLKQTHTAALSGGFEGRSSTETTTASGEREPDLSRQQQRVQRTEGASVWESPKYETNSRWYDPDLDRDVLVDQKRHAVRFVRCCPKCRKQHIEHQEEEEDIAHLLSEMCSECHRIETQQQTKLQEGFTDSPNLAWGAQRLLALPPPLLGLYRPTMWRSYGPDEIRRAVWFLDTPQNGPQPYGEDAQAILEDAYHFLKWTIDSKRIKVLSNYEDHIDDADDTENGENSSGDNVLLTVQVPSPDNGEQQLVQFSSLALATAIGRGLGGAIALFKRRVYRGASDCFKNDGTESTNEAFTSKHAEDIPLPVDEESRWTTTTDDALERLGLTISSDEFLSKNKETERLKIDLAYNEYLPDFDKEQEMEDILEDSLDENEPPLPTLFEKHIREDLPSLAFPVESTNSNLCDNDADSSEADHLILVIHGLGEMMKAFDLFGLKKVPTIVDCCGYLRDNHTEISDARVAQTYQTIDRGTGSEKYGHVEYLPVEWHEAFSIQSTRRPSAEPMSSDTNRRKSKVSIDDISLRTIPTLRSFANDTLMDILYFMSPVHHDIIIDIVTFELNFIVKRFRKLTGFKGEISIIGHSLGSIVAWDILDHQQKKSTVPQSESTPTKDNDSYRYPQLNFRTNTVFLLGSPIPVFLMIRNQENPLAATFALSGCAKVFNIFHPYDPVSYRIEPLLHPRNAEIEPDIMTHWNGGFRFQYQTKRLWKKLVDQTLRAEENMIHSLESGIQALGLVDSTFTGNTPRECEDENNSSHALLTGSLNGGRRIDYMLQEKEIENANEYVAALAAHSCYWLEKDLSLFIANEICLEKKKSCT